MLDAIKDIEKEQLKKPTKANEKHHTVPNPKTKKVKKNFFGGKEIESYGDSNDSDDSSSDEVDTTDKPNPEPVADKPNPEPVAVINPEPVADKPNPEPVAENPNPEPVGDKITESINSSLINIKKQ